MESCSHAVMVVDVCAGGCGFGALGDFSLDGKIALMQLQRLVGQKSCSRACRGLWLPALKVIKKRSLKAATSMIMPHN